MKISIVTTSYNAEEYIEETIESVLYQRGNFEIEYIIYDAESKDKTWEKILKYKKMVDEGFFKDRNLGITMHVFQEKDNGMYNGIAKGFQKCTGDVVAYINADDFYIPNAFSTVCDVFENLKNVYWITGIVNAYNNKGQNTYNNLELYKKDLILKGYYGGKSKVFIQQESCFWRKECLDGLDYDKFRQFKYAGDFYLWYTFASKYYLYSIESILSGFRVHDNQKSSNIEDYMKEYYTIPNYKIKEPIDTTDHYIFYTYKKCRWHIKRNKEHIKLYLLLFKLNINRYKFKMFVKKIAKLINRKG